MPKNFNVFEKPPKCSIKSIKFKQLRPFKCFGEDQGGDELGQNFNMTSQQYFGRPKNILES